MRLQKFLRLHRLHPDATLGWLSGQAGYADQAHLTRDVRELAGRTPTGVLTQRATIAMR